jgi:membrane-bound serine protease (ClpP class)
MTLAIVLLGLGLVLVLAEVLFPSFGLLSVLAALALGGAVAAAFSESSEAGFAFLVAIALLVPGTILLGFKLLPHSPLAKHLVASGFSFEDGAGIDRRDLALLGVEGTAETPLRPAGMARLAGRRVDVVTRGEHLEAGSRVRVLEVRGNRVVVAALEVPAQAHQQTGGNA